MKVAASATGVDRRRRPGRASGAAKCLVAMALGVAGLLPAKAARADDGRPDLQDAVEYFVTTRSTLTSTSPNRSRMSASEPVFSVDFAGFYVTDHFKGRDPNEHATLVETGVSVSDAITDPWGTKWAAALDLSQTRDLRRDYLPTVDNTYRASLSHDLDCCNRLVQVSGWVFYDDGHTQGLRQDASWSPGITVSAPLQLREGTVERRGLRSHNIMMAGDAPSEDKLLPWVSISEQISRIVSGTAGRTWEAELGLGYEHALGNDWSFSASVQADHNHEADDWSYAAHLSLKQQMEGDWSWGVFLILQKGQFINDHHTEVAGVSLSLQFH